MIHVYTPLKRDISATISKYFNDYVNS